MLRSERIERILNVVRDKRCIRNVGVVAHIDHGKTTLTDLLLAEAGLIPHNLAGEIRVLDYLEEEQRRGITIKSANISLLYNAGGGSYVVNLADTPGHVDFTGRVTRALRIIDGAIVLVDAVEEVMAQTEVVMRQALGERVKPVLFINKVDRLIRELRLTAEGIRRKISRIIQDFNSLIDLYGEVPFKDEWKVSASRGNIVIGSALHRWGLNLKTAMEKGIRFNEIIEMYRDEGWRELQEIMPLHKAILEMIIERLPSPSEAQKYRIPKIWKGDLTSEIGRAMLECDPNGPTAICIASVRMEPRSGLVATGRIFSGEIKDGDQIYLLNAGRECIVHEVSIYMGAFREVAGWLDSGNIVALPKIEPISAGETIINPAYKRHMMPFEKITYVSEPVMTVSIEPKRPEDLSRLIEVLNILSIEDPNLMVSINRETGEYLLSGIGELHLDIAIKSMREHDPSLEVLVSSPIIAYRESISMNGEIVEASSPNRRNHVSVRVRPLKGQKLESLDVLEGLAGSLGAHVGLNGKILSVEKNRNILVDLTGREFSAEDLDAIIEGFRWACQSGPLCGEPLRDLIVELVDVQLSEGREQRGHAQIIPAMKRAVISSLLTAGPVLLEPIYRIQILVPSDWVGNVINLVVRRRGKISSVSQRGPSLVIDGLIPVIESFGLADEMRSASSGRAFWQAQFYGWERVPEDRMAQVIRLVRARKGLPSED